MYTNRSPRNSNRLHEPPANRQRSAQDPALKTGWRSGIYTEPARRSAFIFRRTARNAPLATLGIAALCIATVLTSVLAGHAALNGVFEQLTSGESADSVMRVAEGSASPAAPRSTPKRDWARGSAPYLYQKDVRWASEPYADGTIGDSGCGPTCLSIVYVQLTGKKDMGPAETAAFSQQNGHVSDGMSSWSLMTQGAGDLGLTSWEVDFEEENIRAELAAGTPMIASMLPGDFTDNGHFIVLCGLDAQGRAIIRDPNGAENSAKAWEIDRIMGQCANLWGFAL